MNTDKSRFFKLLRKAAPPSPPPAKETPGTFPTDFDLWVELKEFLIRAEMWQYAHLVRQQTDRLSALQQGEAPRAFVDQKEERGSIDVKKELDAMVQLLTLLAAAQKERDEVHAVLDHPDCKIVRDAADGYPEGRGHRILTLKERTEALLRMKRDYRAWLEECEKERDSLIAQRSTFLKSIDELIASLGHQSDAVGLDRPGGEELALAEIRKCVEGLKAQFEEARKEQKNWEQLHAANELCINRQKAEIIRLQGVIGESNQELSQRPRLTVEQVDKILQETHDTSTPGTWGNKITDRLNSLLFPEPPKEDTTTCEDMLRVVLPMAKGWVKEHDVGSNKAIIEHAEEVLRLAAREVC